ncbi:hypothetical protein CEE69_08030 [Rhodopirellula bahusiensis]|uniref:Uncharacterized protein n=2 Tax=Rhodopirellula bahusiensis TaxID=2014065 RepID=A0A2G1W9Z0_9BACT|nr:hypothetical protein CEE69_08030 [Rhodopirellula bahusiensis]
MASDGKQISNPFSTGGGGVNFEVQVQASFVALMLAGGFAPCLPCRPIRKLKLQGKYAGYHTDDLIVFTGDEGDSEERKILGQIKHSITITENNTVFADVIRGAWNDFSNGSIFTTGKDAIALITGPLSATDITDVRVLLEWSRSSESPQEFIEKVETTNFSSASKRKKLQAFRSHLDSAKGEAITDDDIFQFLRHFHLLGYDLDIRSGVMHAILHSLIGQYSPKNAASLWALIVQEVAFANQNAGTITCKSVQHDLRSAFEKRAVRQMPESLSHTLPPRKVHDWNTSEFASALVITNLLGSWDENSETDIEIARRLVDVPFEDWQSKIRQVLLLPDSPLSLGNGVWSVRQRGDLWQALGPSVFDAHLDAFKRCALAVLPEIDPQFDLNPNERLTANIHGKVLAHSRYLRKGLAESLALVGGRPECLENCSRDKPRTIAVEVIRELLQDTDWRFWGSINDLLPLLAETSPEEFLSAVEAALRQQPCPFDELFSQEGKGITGRNYVTGLLWALESIAWSETDIVRATVVLARLAERDPGGQWANRPASSLAHIFLPWFPQTTASIEKRKIAVRTLCKESPEIAWKLLLNLLPGQVSASSGTHKPIWRRVIPDDWEDGTTQEEHWEQICNYAEMAVGIAENEMSKLNQLIEHLDNLPRPACERLLGHISSDEITSKLEVERLGLWTALVEVASKHRRYSDADWAFPDDLVSQIEAAAAVLAPKDPSNRYQRLFCGRDWELYEESGNWQEQKKQLELRRHKVMQDLLDAGGIEHAVRFAESVESPQQVGFSLGRIAVEDVDASVLPSMLNASNEKHSGLAAGFVWGRFQEKGWAWVDATFVSAWSKEDIGRSLSILPFVNNTWQRVDQLLKDDTSEYWRKVVVNPYQAEGRLCTAIENLLEHERPWAAIDCLAKLAHDNERLNKQQAVRALLDAVSSNPTSGDGYHAVQVIKSLQEDPETNEEDLFRIEWAYVALLDGHHGATPRYLESRLANDPAFFCELIRMIFRSRNVTPSDEEPSEEERTLATNAWRLLHEWRTPPGTDRLGNFSGPAFKRWIDDVRQSASDSGHLEVALSNAGNVLIHSPPDPSGLTIHCAVAEVLNADDSEEIRRGFAMAIHNSRGVHCVDPTGKPERDLAAKYRGQAEEMEDAGFHRLATTLRGVAESYDREAERIVEEHKTELE